jgi:hypothetical protein
VDERLKPVGVGLLAGLSSFVLPGSLGVVIMVVAALAAGWVLPSAPMAAALLFLAPALVLGAVRLLLDDSDVAVSTLLLALVSAVMVVAVFTHVGAGIALRRAAPTE